MDKLVPGVIIIISMDETHGLGEEFIRQLYMRASIYLLDLILGYFGRETRRFAGRHKALEIERG
jgi:hypothetical protein